MFSVSLFNQYKLFMHFFILFCCCFLFLRVSGTAQVLQNMVKNPSFEQYDKVPTDLGELQLIDYWDSPTNASPDYFHRRAAGQNVDVPLNKMGAANARSGHAYVGVYAYASRYIKRNFREYLQLELKQPMIAGHIYCVKAHVYLSESSNRSIAAFGMTASKIKMLQEHEMNISTKQRIMYLRNADETPLDERKWVEVSCRFKAIGGERHVVLGNLDDDRKTVVTGAIVSEKFQNPHVDFAYYFIDDVCITDASSNFSCDCGSFDLIRTRGEERIVVDMKVQKKTYQDGQIVIMDNLEFEPGKSTIMNGSHAAIYDLIGTLRLHLDYKAEISGHTDDRGDPQKNQILSKKRAEAVYKFLLSSGIDASRLSFKGYGQSRPIALNKTSEGRKKNERIQVMISKK